MQETDRQSTDGATETTRKLVAAAHRRAQAQLVGVDSAITDLVTKRKLDAATIEEIEDVLIRADLGLDTAGRIADALREGRYEAAIRPTR